MMRFRKSSPPAALASAALLAAVPWSAPSFAADHQEAPITQAMLAADIGDYYVWHENDRVNLVLTFGTFAAAGAPASFDRSLLYGFHFDTSVPADGTSEVDVYARFAQDDAGDWGMQVFDQSGTLIEGATETVLTGGDAMAWSGLADDPFFFDQSGFRDTVGTGILSFDPTRDDVAGLNVTAIVLQLPLAALQTSDGRVETWATSSSL